MKNTNVFQEMPIVGWKKTKTVKDYLTYLVRAKLPNLVELLGCNPCHKRRFQVYSYLGQGKIFIHNDKSEHFEIRCTELKCDLSNVFYLIDCKTCCTCR